MFTLGHIFHVKSAICSLCLSSVISSVLSESTAAPSVSLIQQQHVAPCCAGKQTLPTAPTSKYTDPLHFPETSLDTASCFSRPGMGWQHQVGCYSWFWLYSPSPFFLPHLLRKHTEQGLLFADIPLDFFLIITIINILKSGSSWL